MKHVGLRVDVDTLRGTRFGVPRLLALFARHHIRATFFFSVGPDNMGRHLWRLLRPRFLLKMLRTRAASLYGWDILLRGTVWPGPEIGRRCSAVIKKTADDGHEVGLHAWDHHRWQAHLTHMDRQELLIEIGKGYEALTNILGRPPSCFAAPAWHITPEALIALEQFAFTFQSDCRGWAPFRPVIQGRQYQHIQIPTTLPTYDELIGRVCTLKTYNQYLLSLIQPDCCNVLTIHAEVEGGERLDQLEEFICQARQQSIVFETLGETLSRSNNIVTADLEQKMIAGRDGVLACQKKSIEPETKISGEQGL